MKVGFKNDLCVIKNTVSLSQTTVYSIIEEYKKYNNKTAVKAMLNPSL